MLNRRSFLAVLAAPALLAGRKVAQIRFVGLRVLCIQPPRTRTSGPRYKASRRCKA